MDFYVIPYFKVKLTNIIFEIKIIKEFLIIANRNHIVLINVDR